MLQAIRDRASGWIAYIIVLLISIPFALWGIQEYFGGGDPRIAAEVNGEEIPMFVFNRELQQQKQYLRAMMGGQLPAQYSDLALRESVLSRVVRNELIRQELDAAGYQIGDRVLFDQIRSMPQFTKNGIFDKQRYEQTLNTMMRTPAQFEQEMSQQIRVSQFVDGISESAFLPAPSFDDYLRLKNQEREISYFKISTDLEKAKAEVTQEQINAFFEDNKHLFQTSERVKLSYIEIQEKNLIERMQVDEEMLRQAYEERADLYVIPEQRRARHILFKIPPASAEDAEKETREIKRRAEQLVSRLRSGEDFAVLAEQYSQDPLSAKKGGELGIIAPGDMDPDFEGALFAMELDQISDPITTPNGIHIIQLTEVTPKQQKEFDQVRDQVALDYKQRMAESEFLELTEQLLTLSYEQPDSLDPVAAALGLAVKESDWLTRDQGEGLGAYPEIRQQAFNQEVLEQGRNSDLIELDDGHVVVIRIKEHEDAKPKTLQEVEEEIKDLVAEKNARMQSAERAKEAINELHSGSDVATVAQKYSSELKEPGFVKRNDTQVPEPILSKAFMLARPSSDTETVDSLAIADSDYAVVLLKSVREPDANNADNERKADEMRQAREYATREIEACLEAMEATADVRIMRENFDNL